MNKDLVWYACYGSNLYYERFLCYIQGGTCAANGKSYDGCQDRTPPRKSRPAIIPYELYFGNKSSKWDNCGVAFLDIDKRAVTLGRMYLITSAQFEEVWTQECKGEEWYDRVLILGEHEDCQVKTFTNSKRRKECRPSPAYLEVMRKGMLQMLPPAAVLKS